jgi:para-nitrobenzyl esterase
MKKITLFLSMLLTGSMFAQTPCSNGRYSSDVFTNYTTTSDITFGSNTSFNGSTTTLKLDFYEPTGDTETARPLIIWVHGGSFIGGSKTDVDVQTWSQRFALKGYACASINYRLGFFPVDSANAVKAVVRATQDLKAAIRFFYKDRLTTNTYKIDTTQIFIGGSSAGAITALHVAYLDDVCEISDYLNSATITSLGGLEGNSGNPGYSTNVKGVINGCGALARYSWMQAGDVPLCSIHGTADGTVKYNRGVVNPGTPLMYLDGSRMLHERACAIGVENQFYTFSGAPHVPYAGNASYMDTTVNFIRDFLVKRLGCADNLLQPENTRMETANLYAINYCNGSPVNEACPTTGITEESLVSFLLYPNPTANLLNIKTETEGKFDLTIVDLTGRKVLNKTNLNGHVTIDLSPLNKGNYIVKLSQNNNFTVEKLIIE